MDIRDLFRPGSGLTPRYVWTLVKYLPLGSAFVAERSGGQQFRGWDESRYALAVTANSIRALHYSYMSAHSKSKPTKPEPFPIPEKENKAEKPGTFAFVAKQALAAANKKRKAKK